MRHGIVGPLLNCLPVVTLGYRKSALFREEETQVGMGFRKLRPQIQRSAQACFSFGESALQAQSIAEMAEVRRRSRLQRNGFEVAIDRGLHLLQLQIYVSDVVVNLRARRVDRRGSMQERQCCREIPQRRKQVTEIVVRAEGRRIDRQRLSIAADGSRPIAFVVQ